MKLKKLKISAILLVSMNFSGVYAQESLPSSGGNASGSGGSASYTVGQIAYFTNTGFNGSVAQGVQQPYEILVITTIKEAKGTNLICSAYPNPTPDFLILKIENYDKEDLSYQLYDLNGKLLVTKKVIGNTTTISMGNYAPSTYILKVTDKDQKSRTFQIIKK